MAVRLKPGVHRVVGKDGTIAAMIVSAEHPGRMVEFMILGQQAPRARVQRRWIAASMAVLRERAERRRLAALIEAMP